MQPILKFSEEIIKKQQETIRKIGELGPDQLAKSLQFIKTRLKIYTISYALFLIYNEFFLQLKFQNMNEGLKKAIQYIVAVCENYNDKFFQLEKQKNRKIIYQIKQNKGDYESAMQLAKKEMEQQQKNKPKEQGIKVLLNAILKLMKQSKDSKQLKQAVHLAFYVKREKEATKHQTQTNAEAFFQHSSNYLRLVLDNIRKKTNPTLICCKPIFFDKEQINSSEGASQQFKRYTWPITNISIKNHVTKTIIGFMNSKGGIIYIGVLENKDKKNEVIGIQLTNTNIKQIQMFITDIVANIFPQHDQFKIEDSTKQRTNSNAKEFVINNYVKMEFMPVVNLQTLTNMTYKNDKGDTIVSKLYVVKVIMKIGHPKHLYHVVNQDKNIDFYERVDRNVDKKTFPEAYKQIYERLEKFEKIKKSGYKNFLDRHLFHNHCRYEMTVKLQLQSDKQSSSDDD